MKIFYIEDIHRYEEYICNEKQILRIVDTKCNECLVVYIKLIDSVIELRLMNTYSGEDMLIKNVDNDNNIIDIKHREKINLSKNLEGAQEYMLHNIYL